MQGLHLIRDLPGSKDAVPLMPSGTCFACAGRLTVPQVAEQLAALAVAHGFDGWLINIENRMGGRELRHLQVGCVLSGDGGRFLWQAVY
jgi:hypothetical protein